MYLTINNIKVIPDAYKNLPTSISVNYSKDMVLQGEELVVENITADVTFGYGYDVMQISGADEKDNFTISCDTSEPGMRFYTVTYTIGGITLKANAYVFVISLENALSNNISDLGYTSYLLYSGEATEEALLSKLNLGSYLRLKYYDFSISESGLNMHAANEYWKNNGINVWFAVKNADGEYGKFDGTDGTLRNCTVYICAEYYGHEAKVELFELYYAVAEPGISEITSIGSVYFDRSVILEEEKNSGSWKNLVRINYVFAESNNFYDIQLNEFLAENKEFTAELVYDYDKEYYTAVIKSPYAYYRYNDLTVVPDDEANKITSIHVSYSVQNIMADAMPVPGKDFTLMAEYGYGYKTEELLDYSSVTVKLDEDYGFDRRYVITYGEVTCEIFFSVIRSLELDLSNMLVVSYTVGDDIKDVRLFGYVTYNVNYGSNSGDFYAEGHTLAEYNEELRRITGIELTLEGLDTSKKYYEQGEIICRYEGYRSNPMMAMEANVGYVRSVNLTSVVYSQNCDLSEVTVSGDINYTVTYDSFRGMSASHNSFDDRTIQSLNEEYAQYDMTFEIVGLDTSLPAEGQSVYLVVSRKQSEAITPSLKVS